MDTRTSRTGALRLEDAPDAFLVDRAADGDAEAFAVLVRRYSRLLRSYAARILGRIVGSDDVVQEALITAWQQLGTLDDRSAVKGWLVRITTRKALDVIRAVRYHDDVDTIEVPDDVGRRPDSVAQAGSIDAALATALSGLPDAQRRAWVLRELAGYSYDEIATELDLPLSTVRGLLSRARSRLMHEMDEWR